jgi:raffinose/stachyose/melibiose transport system permease protein
MTGRLSGKEDCVPAQVRGGEAAAVAPERRPGPPPTPQRGPQRRQVWPLLFLLPSALLVLAFVIVPSVFGGAYAFTDWDGLVWNFNWVGFANFRDFFEDPAAYGALINTLTITIAVTVGQNVVGLLLALALNSRIKSRRVLRVVFFAPVIVTPVVVAYVWAFMYAPSGPINKALETIGLGNLQQVWLGDPDVTLWAIIVIIIWQFSGYVMVIYLAGLQNVPAELVDAAQLDGARSVQVFRYVVLPLLKPAITVATLLTIIGGLKVFDQIWVLTRGGPNNSTHSLSTIVYQTAFVFGEYGYATAIAIIMTVLIVFFSIAQMWFTRKKVEA